jgi:glycosyltransferase involved in cell wall biosynthesis
MRKPSVSVIIPVYENTRYLQQAIESVTTQSYPHIETIVVDDGSSATAAQSIQRICALYPGITLIHQPNTGPSLARRAGMLRSKGKLVIFLDADDVLLQGAVTHLTQHFARCPEAVAVYGSKLMLDSNGGFLDRRRYPQPEEAISGDILPALLKGKPLLSNGSVCIARAALEGIAFPENIRQAEDWILWCRLACRGPIHYAGHRPVLGIRNHTDNASHAAVQQPALLLSALPHVYDDQEVKNRISLWRLEIYHLLHRINIHSYCARELMLKRRYFGAFRQMLARMTLAKTTKTHRRRIVHIVKHFYAGGAERLLSSVLQHSDAQKYEHIVISLSDEQERIGDIEARLGIPYHSLVLSNGWRRIIAYGYLYSLIRSLNPDVIKTWLPPANLAGGVIGRLLRVPVIWGVHDAQPFQQQPKATRLQVPLSRILPHHIACCSETVTAMCRLAGMPAGKLRVVPNGVDTDFFAPDKQAGIRFRKELGLSRNNVVIGMAAEATPIKRHHYFLQAAKHFLHFHPHARFVLCGKWVEPSNPALTGWIKELGLEKSVLLLGIRDDMPAFYAALDINVLVSHTESFGLCIAEAMACNTLCVATDTGMMRTLLQDVGTILPVSEDTGALMAAWQQILNLPEKEKEARRQKGRARILHHFSITETAKHYDALFARP